MRAVRVKRESHQSDGLLAIRFRVLVAPGYFRTWGGASEAHDRAKDDEIVHIDACAAAIASDVHSFERFHDYIERCDCSIVDESPEIAAMPNDFPFHMPWRDFRFFDGVRSFLRFGLSDERGVGFFGEGFGRVACVSRFVSRELCGDLGGSGGLRLNDSGNGRDSGEDNATKRDNQCGHFHGAHSIDNQALAVVGVARLEGLGNEMIGMGV